MKIYCGTLQLQVSQTGVERVDIITGVSLQEKLLHAPRAIAAVSLRCAIVSGWYLTSNG